MDQPGDSPAPMLVYDGECAFCARAVRFVLRHERRHNLLFVTRQSPLGVRLRREFDLEAVESMLWIENGRAFACSEAVRRAAAYMGGPWAVAAAMARCAPLTLRDRAYGFIAARRRRLASKSSDCPLPTPEQRARFAE